MALKRIDGCVWQRKKIRFLLGKFLNLACIEVETFSYLEVIFTFEKIKAL
jgi:hypothetical protein